jgi:hypothetical protein
MFNRAHHRDYVGALYVGGVSTYKCLQVLHLTLVETARSATLRVLTLYLSCHNCQSTKREMNSTFINCTGWMILEMVNLFTGVVVQRGYQEWPDLSAKQ